MESVVLVIHLILALAIIILVLLQRSEGGGLGIGGGGGGLGGFASARSTANALTRMTAICAAAFFTTSLALGVMAGAHSSANKSILEALSADEVKASMPAPEEVPEAPIALDMPAEALKVISEGTDTPAVEKEQQPDENAQEQQQDSSDQKTTTTDETPEPAAPVAQ